MCLCVWVLTTIQLKSPNELWHFRKNTHSYLHILLKLGGGFQYFLFSPRKLGFHDPIWRAYFSNGVGEPTTNQWNWSSSGPYRYKTSRWFKVPFPSPSWRSLNPLKGSLNHPKKGTKNCQDIKFSQAYFYAQKNPNLRPLRNQTESHSYSRAVEKVHPGWFVW